MGNSGSGHAGYMPRNKEEQQILACVKARDIKGLDLIVEKKKPSVELLNSALHVAVMLGFMDVVNRLVELGGDLTALVNDPFIYPTAGFTGGKQVSALHKAALSGQTEIFQLLMQSPKCAQLIDAKCTLTREYLFGEIDGVNPLFCLLAGDFKKEQERLQCVNMILDKNIGLECKYSNGMTPLLVALYYARTDIARALIARHANFRITMSDGKGVFHYYGIGITRWIAQQVNRNLKDLRDVYNIGIQEAELVNFLQRFGIDINGKDNEGNTPLHAACYSWSYEAYDWPFKISFLDHWETLERTPFFKAMVAAKADLTLKNNKGHTPQDVVMKGVGFKQAEQDRMKRGAEVDKKHKK